MVDPSQWAWGPKERVRETTRYTDEFKREVVRLFREIGKTKREQASNLGVSSYSIRRLEPEAGGAAGDGGDTPSVVEREEIRRLR